MNLRKYVAGAAMVAATMGGTVIPSMASETTSAPRPPVHRATIALGQSSSSFYNGGPICWDLRERLNGRWVVIVKSGQRAEPGAPCRGQRVARVRLSNRFGPIAEDNVTVRTWECVLVVQADAYGERPENA